MTHIGDPQGFLEFYASRKTASLNWKRQREYKMRGLLDHQNSTGTKQADNNTQLQTCTNFPEK